MSLLKQRLLEYIDDSVGPNGPCALRRVSPTIMGGYKSEARGVHAGQLYHTELLFYEDRYGGCLTHAPYTIKVRLSIMFFVSGFCFCLRTSHRCTACGCSAESVGMGFLLTHESSDCRAGDIPASHAYW